MKNIDCERAIRLVAGYLDDELQGSDRQQLESHLDTCLSCYSRAEFERRLKEQLAALRQHRPDAPLEGRIRRLVADFKTE